jgi:hypothetical protein
MLYLVLLMLGLTNGETKSKRRSFSDLSKTMELIKLERKDSLHTAMNSLMQDSRGEV